MLFRSGPLGGRLGAPQRKAREVDGEVPVYNVSVPVMGEDWWVFEMSGAKRVPSEVH